MCFGSARFIFAVCFLSAVQTSSDMSAVSVSFIEALKAYEVSGCGFNPNERANNFKTGPLRGQSDVYLQRLLLVLSSRAAPNLERTQTNTRSFQGLLF